MTTVLRGMCSSMFLLAGVWPIAAQASHPTQPVALPNILLLIADDLGYGELGCQGNNQIPTPHIDALAEGGVRFTQAYVTAPNCSPSRAGIFSGCFPTRFGYEFNPVGAENDEPDRGLPSKLQILPELLRAAGYMTGLVGKWHLGGTAKYHPLRHGFGEFFGFTHEGHYYVPTHDNSVHSMLRRASLPAGEQTPFHLRHNVWLSTHMGHDEPAYDANNPILRNGQPVDEADYLTDAFTREAIRFIEQNHNAPWFLTLSYNAVHSPLQGKTTTYRSLASIDNPHRRIFASMVVDLDCSVGMVLGRLKELQLADRTLVFFLSDNGGPTKELTSSNRPLRGGKGSMYEGGIRVPFIVSWPGTIPGGAQCDDTVSAVDIYATAASASGTPPPEGIDGIDLLPLLVAGTSVDAHPRTLYWRQGRRAALRRNEWKIVSSDCHAVDPPWELYNLSNDLRESMNLAQSYPGVLQQLISSWEQLDSQMADPLFR